MKMDMWITQFHKDRKKLSIEAALCLIMCELFFEQFSAQTYNKLICYL